MQRAQRGQCAEREWSGLLHSDEQRQCELAPSLSLRRLPQEHCKSGWLASLGLRHLSMSRRERRRQQQAQSRRVRWNAHRCTPLLHLALPLCSSNQATAERANRPAPQQQTAIASADRVALLALASGADGASDGKATVARQRSRLRELSSGQAAGTRAERS